MSHPLDTPARAARARRPQTRAWRRLLSEATAQDESAVVIRKKLRMHLEAADRLASKRQASNMESETIAHPLQVLDSQETDWKDRVAALESLQANPASFDIDPVVRWLIMQLSELRSAVVISASKAIDAVASANLFSTEQAKEIFVAAAGGVNVSKKLMADARRSAALAVVRRKADVTLLGAAVTVVRDYPHPSARRLALDALVNFINNADRSAEITEAIRDALNLSAVDRSAEVRQGARELSNTFETRFGADEWDRLKETLSTDVAVRLSNKKLTGNDNLENGPGPVKNGKKLALKKSGLTMKEMIRKRREAMKKQNTQANQDHEETTHKRRSEDTKLEERMDPPKRSAFVTSGKENVPQPM